MTAKLLLYGMVMAGFWGAIAPVQASAEDLPEVSGEEGISSPSITSMAPAAAAPTAVLPIPEHAPTVVSEPIDAPPLSPSRPAPAPVAMTVEDWLAQLEASTAVVTDIRLQNTATGLQVALVSDRPLMPSTSQVGTRSFLRFPTPCSIWWTAVLANSLPLLTASP